MRLTLDVDPHMSRDDFLTALDAALADLPPAERVRVARHLGDTVTAAHVRTVADGTVWEMTRSQTYADVAAEIGGSVSVVNKAVKRHNAAGQAA